MEDWQEMGIIILVILLAMIAYFVYLGTQMMSLKDSISNLYNEEQTFGSIQNPQGSSSPVSPLFGIMGGYGGIGR